MSITSQIQHLLTDESDIVKIHVLGRIIGVHYPTTDLSQSDISRIDEIMNDIKELLEVICG